MSYLKMSDAHIFQVYHVWFETLVRCLLRELLCQFGRCACLRPIEDA